MSQSDFTISDEPLVSFIIPAYRHERYVEQCLESVIAQTWERMELIVLNDGSPDGTHDRIMAMRPELRRRFSRFVYVDKPNEGICATLNLGVSLARGELVKYMASDDVIRPRGIETMVRYMQANPQFGIVFSDGYHVDSDPLDAIRGTDAHPDVPEDRRFSHLMEFREGDLFDILLEELFLLPSPTAMFQRRCLVAVGPFDPAIACEDPDMFLRVSRDWPIGFVPDVLVWHRWHDSNSGKDANIVAPAVWKMLSKYPESFFRRPGQRAQLRSMLCRTVGLPDISNLDEILGGRLLVGWGTGGSMRQAVRVLGRSVDFLVDSDPLKHGMVVEGLKVQSPDVLRELGPERAHVLIMSVYRHEIAPMLEAWGFTDSRDYA